MQQGTGASQPAASPAVRVEVGPAGAVQTIPIPRSAQDIRGLQLRRSELENQLESVMDRRGSITAEWERSPGGERATLEQVMSTLDGRIAQLEADIAATEQALASAQPGLFTVAAQVADAERAARESTRSEANENRMAAFFTIVLVFALGLAFAKRLWGRKPPPRRESIESAGRLERIEQAVEAMAIEIERVSEGQRFVTKLMTEAKVAPAIDNARMIPQSPSGRES